MNSTRRRLIVGMVLDFLNEYWSEVDVFFGDANDTSYDHKLVELDINGKLMFSPTAEELKTLEAGGKGGNWRTKQIVTIALAFVIDHLEELQDRYPYDGEQERYVDTHVHFADTNFKMPTKEEIEDLQNELDLIVKNMPPIKPPSVAWNIYGPDESDDEMGEIWLDTVHFDANCDSRYVRDSLINHDGYSPNIVIVS